MSGKLSLKTHVSYGVSQWGLTAIGTAFGVNALYFYTNVIKFDTQLFGLIMLIAQFWDGISDPLMGRVSDNTTWHKGRRRPFLLLGAIPMGIGFFFVFSPPMMESSSVTFIYLTVTMLIFYTGRTVFETPYLALAPELTLDYDERTKLSGWKQFFGVIGDAQGAMLPLLLVAVLGGLRRPAHFVYGLMACVMMIAFAAITRWGTFERPDLAPEEQPDVAESIKAVSRNWPYLIFIFSYTLAQVGNNIVTYLVLFVTEYWFLDPSLAPKFFAAFFIGAICAVPVWARIANLIGKKWTFIIDMTGYGVLLSCIIFFPQDARISVMIMMFFAGCFNSGLWVLSGTIAPDIIEWDEFYTGKRREGIYSGVWTFVYKAGIGMAIMLVGFALKMIHFDAELPAQTESTLAGLRVLFGPISGMFLFIGAIAFFFYPITRRKHEEILNIIEERKKEHPSDN